jgi:hypothetical protein
MDYCRGTVTLRLMLRIVGDETMLSGGRGVGKTSADFRVSKYMFTVNAPQTSSSPSRTSQVVNATTILSTIEGVARDVQQSSRVV